LQSFYKHSITLSGLKEKPQLLCELCENFANFAVKEQNMRKIEHIGIAVNNLETSNLLFEKLFGNPPYKQEEVESEGVKTSFFMNGPNKIELLEATNPESPIAKFIDKKGEGIHHIAFDVADIISEMDDIIGGVLYHLNLDNNLKFVGNNLSPQSINDIRNSIDGIIKSA
jgi:methylmalonyl-CoA/ethylmalonyl-CoA epimerase